MKYLYVLLICIPVAIAGEFLHWNEAIIFAASAVGISATMMTLSVIALGIPSLFGSTVGQRNAGPILPGLQHADRAVCRAALGFSQHRVGR